MAKEEFSFERSLRDLAEWLAASGGFLHPSLDRRPGPYGAGIFSAAALGAGEKFARIPTHLILGPARYAAIRDATTPVLQHERDQTIYALLVELEAGPSSAWAPWLAHLPTLEDFAQYHPLFASAEELSVMRQLCPRVVASLAKFQGRIRSVELACGARFAPDRVLHAGLLFASRAFEGHGLVPVADLFNHDAQRGRGLGADHSLSTGAAVAADAEVCISYGFRLDSVEMWLSFGFEDLVRGPVVNFAAVQVPPHWAPFTHDCYVDRDGPSIALLDHCTQHAPDARAALSQVANMLMSELDTVEPGLVVGTAGLLPTLQHLLAARREVLEPLAG